MEKKIGGNKPINYGYSKKVTDSPKLSEGLVGERMKLELDGTVARRTGQLPLLVGRQQCRGHAQNPTEACFIQAQRGGLGLGFSVVNNPRV